MMKWDYDFLSVKMPLTVAALLAGFMAGGESSEKSASAGHAFASSSEPGVGAIANHRILNWLEGTP